MRQSFALAVLRMVTLAAVAAGAGCYDQPRIPSDQPLSCTGMDPERDCPTGYSCVGTICAPKSCRVSTECPSGTVCRTTGQGGCVLSVDGGGDGSPLGPTLDDPRFDAGGVLGRDGGAN